MGKLLLAMRAPSRQPAWSALALMEGPEWVAAAHQAFVDAGADVLITSNYAVVPYHLGPERFDEQGEELTALAGRLTRDVADGAGRPVRVAGSIPPLFGSYEPASFDPELAPAPLARIAAALAPHVDVFLAETQSCLAEVEASVRAAAPHGRPVWASVTLTDLPPGDRELLRSGETVTDAAALVERLGAEGLLFNCSEPERMEGAVREARQVLPATVTVGAYANAFERKPEVYSANGVILDHRADLDGGGYTRFVERWLDAGADLVGGCCGIMPRHIAELAALRDDSYPAGSG
jgi:S-methylmethionine-dependent homocysteine/selenocysteine methylase